MAITKITSHVNGEEIKLNYDGGVTYQGDGIAPKLGVKTTNETEYFPVVVTVQDEAGNTTTDSTHILAVKSKFEFAFILSAPDGEELAYLDGLMDMEIGGNNNFELEIPMEEWSEELYSYGSRLYIPDTEYGGLIEDMEVITNHNTIYLYGDTWRGLLSKKVVEPPAGQDNLILNGELHQVLKELLGDKLEPLFKVDDIDTEVVVTNWVVDRYSTLYDAMEKLLSSKGYALRISYRQGLGIETGCVYLRASPIRDMSEEIEYSQDSKIDFNIRDCRNGINHLICAGGGEGAERLVLHLYVQEDGTIGNKQYFYGLAERAHFYDYRNAEDIEVLEDKGKIKLKELMNYQKLELLVNDIDLEIGDIVGGREHITGIEMSAPVVRKILKAQKKLVTVEYKLKGEKTWDLKQ